MERGPWQISKDVHSWPFNLAAFLARCGRRYSSDGGCGDVVAGVAMVGIVGRVAMAVMVAMVGVHVWLSRVWGRTATLPRACPPVSPRCAVPLLCSQGGPLPWKTDAWRARLPLGSAPPASRACTATSLFPLIAISSAVWPPCQRRGGE